MKAIVRNLEDGIPHASIKLNKQECENLKFDCCLFDEGYGWYEELYDVALVHPVTGKVFGAYRYDFSFEKEPE